MSLINKMYSKILWLHCAPTAASRARPHSLTTRIMVCKELRVLMHTYDFAISKCKISVVLWLGGFYYQKILFAIKTVFEETVIERDYICDVF